MIRSPLDDTSRTGVERHLGASTRRRHLLIAFEDKVLDVLALAFRQQTPDIAFAISLPDPLLLEMPSSSRGLTDPVND